MFNEVEQQRADEIAKSKAIVQFVNFVQDKRDWMQEQVDDGSMTVDEMNSEMDRYMQEVIKFVQS